MKRGRTSVAELAAPSLAVGDVSTSGRIQCPVHLSDAIRGVWISLVNDLPGGSFTEKDVPLMEAYCHHVVRGRVIADQIDAFDPAWLADDDGLKRFERLTAIAEREARAASSLATRLRITRQAMADAKTVGRANKNQSRFQRPWESGASE